MDTLGPIMNIGASEHWGKMGIWGKLHTRKKSEKSEELGTGVGVGRVGGVGVGGLVSEGLGVLGSGGGDEGVRVEGVGDRGIEGAGGVGVWDGVLRSEVLGSGGLEVLGSEGLMMGGWSRGVGVGVLGLGRLGSGG